MSETITLDPTEETTGRVEFDLTPFVGPSGPDWGDAVIEAYMAELSRGQVPIDYRLPNRTITIPLNLFAHGALSYDDVRTMVQAKVGLWQREGGVLKRDIDGTPWYADIVNATLKMGGSTAQAVFDIDADAVLTLEAIPDWYGEEIDLGTETGTGEVAAVFEPGKGDHDGRVRIVITDSSGHAQRGLLWGIRSRHYSDDATAALAYAAADMTVLDVATVEADGIQHASVAPNWTPVLSTDLDGVGALTHVGGYRVWARAATTAGSVRLRLLWSVGDISGPAINATATLPAAEIDSVPTGNGGDHLLDLGAIRVRQAPVGTHGWSGQIQAYAADEEGVGISPNTDVTIKRVWFQPVDDYSGRLSFGLRSVGTLTEFVARDEFDQGDGLLDGATAPVGGTWDVTGDDFETISAYHVAEHSDGTSVAVIGDESEVAVRCDIKFLTALPNDTSAETGIVARYVDSSNRLRVVVNTFLSTIKMVVFAGGSVTASAQRTLPSDIVLDAWYTMQLQVTADGLAAAWLRARGVVAGEPLLSLQSDDLATGGALESGAVGLWDIGGSDDGIRHFDNFAAWNPTPDPVINANRTLELRHNGAFREVPAGGAYSEIIPIGDLPRLPPPGLEDRVSELLVVPSRGDLDQIPDVARDDDLEVQVLYRPSYLFVPDPSPGS